MNSGEVIRKTNITRDTIRYYIKLGLLKPKINKDNGYKEYSEEDLWLIEFIKSAKDIGFSLKDIKELSEHMKNAECKHKSLVPFLNKRLDEVNVKIASLKHIKKHLEFLIKDFNKRDCSKNPSDLEL